MKKTQTDRPAILPMAEIKQLDTGALTNLFVTSSNASRVAYLESAKALIALVAALGIEAAKTRLLKAGAKESDIRNGRQLSLVWEEYVEPGHLSEDQFNELRYLDAVALRAVARTRGTEFAIANLADLEEIAHVAEHGMTRAESATKADREAKAAAKKAAATPTVVAVASSAAPSADATPTAPTATATEGLPSNVVPMQGPAASGAKTEATAPAKPKSKGVPMAEFAKLADTLEATALGIVSHPNATPAELAVLVERVVNLARTVSEAAAQVQVPRVAVAA
jgi:hypothetical protein